MNVSYIRVSTIDQNTARQEEGLKPYNIEKSFIEKISGKNAKRPELQKALEFCREGDILYVWDFSRLARSTIDLLNIAELLTSKGVTLVSIKENIDTSTPQGKLMLTLIGAIAEFERTSLLEKQREGIAIAKVAGKYKGRKPIKVDDFKQYYDDYMQRRINKSQLAKKLKISRPILNKLFNEYIQTNSI
ncbi:MAG: recombinase family protein [Clostridia bacterium]|nr:recombinase family protein [Clostridia bacterium]